MKNIFYISSMLIILALGLSSCDKHIESQNINTNISSDILYNPFLQQLVKYDSKSGKEGLWDDTNNQFQYQIPNSDDLYINGNSINSSFSLIRVNKNDTELLYDFKKNEGAFPISLVGNKLYFIHTYYENSGLEKEDKRKIGIYDIDKKEVVDFKNTSGLISKGKANNQYLFYSTYNNDEDKYDLQKLKLGKNEVYNKPELVMSNLSHGDIYVKNNEICTTDAHNIMCKDQKWDSKVVNYFKGSKLVQIYPEEPSGLKLSISNTDKNKEKIIVDKVNGIKFEGDSIIVSTSSGIEKYNL